MAFPDTMKTCVLKIGTPLILLDTKVQTSISIQPSDYITWEPTGQAFVPLQETGRRQDEYEIVVPAVDQAGFIDAAGNPIVNFHFTVVVTYVASGQTYTVTKTIQPLSDQLEVDFDLVPFGNPVAPILGNVGFVTSVNGLTGAVDVTMIEGTPGATGAQGPQGPIGPQGDPGPAGADGADGAPGAPGAPGVNGSDGLPGAPGADGAKGDDGAPGAAGPSAYQVAVAAGYLGTQSAWLDSLKGTPGADGNDGAQGIQGIPGTNGTNGAKGDQGIQGPPGPSSLMVVRKSGSTWPARPTADPTITVAWLGADPSPTIVTTGTGGMRDNIDVRWVA